MNQTDEWERDPSIQIMSRVFRAMEDAQAQLLRRLGINPYDIRVREWREKALELFERAWMTANRIGMNMDEGTASALYVRGLAKIMSSDGVEIPSGILPAEEKVEKIFMEILK